MLLERPSSSSLRVSLAAVPPAVSADQWELARRIHRSMLPAQFRDGRAEVAVSYEEHEILGGDYCNLFRTDEDNLFLCTMSSQLMFVVESDSISSQLIPVFDS